MSWLISASTATPSHSGPGSAILHWDPTGHTDVDVSLTEAVLRLRAIAYAEDRSINDLAADIVSRRRRLSKEDS